MPEPTLTLDQLRARQPVTHTVKLDADAAQRLRELYWSQSAKMSELATLFGVSRSTVKCVIKRWTWTDGDLVTGEPTHG